MRHAFFHRIDGLSLVDGNKSAGFVLSVSTPALVALAKVKVEPAVQARIVERAKERIAQAKLLPKALLKGTRIVFWENTLVPRVFAADPMFGGSIGANPETFSRLDRTDQAAWLGDEVDYTPHNCDNGKEALALMLLVQTWSEFAHSYLYQASKTDEG